jgi:hypothetical protein
MPLVEQLIAVMVAFTAMVGAVYAVLVLLVQRRERTDQLAACCALLAAQRMEHEDLTRRIGRVEARLEEGRAGEARVEGPSRPVV